MRIVYSVYLWGNSINKALGTHTQAYNLSLWFSNVKFSKQKLLNSVVDGSLFRFFRISELFFVNCYVNFINNFSLFDNCQFHMNLFNVENVLKEGKVTGSIQFSSPQRASLLAKGLLILEEGWFQRTKSKEKTLTR